MQEERFDSGDGLSIFFRSWRPTTKPRGAVVIVHGFNAHSGYYGWVAEKLVKDGLAVYALDLRGRGQSDGERFYVERFADYVGDVQTFVALVKGREPRLPVFLLVTAPAASLRASTASTISRNWPASSARASRSRYPLRTLRWRC